MNLHEEIARMAYKLYEESGCSGGRDCENWLNAERIVLMRHASQDIEEPEGEEPMIGEETIREEVEEKGLRYASQKIEEEATVIEEIDEREPVISTGENIAIKTERNKPVNTITDKDVQMSSGWFEVKKATNDQLYFNLKAGNAETILSSEQYTSRAACNNGIASVQSNSRDDANYERKDAKNGKPYFVLKAKNHQVIGKSQMYKSASGMENGIKSVMVNGATTTIKDETA